MLANWSRNNAWMSLVFRNTAYILHALHYSAHETQALFNNWDTRVAGSNEQN
jgi:hypothetical protein